MGRKAGARRLSRRRFLRITALGTLAGGALVVGDQVLNGRYRIQTTRREIEIEGLPAGFDGFRIVQLTDLHHGRQVPLELVSRSVAAANAAEPDLVVLTGDYVTGSARYARPCAQELQGLRAPRGLIAVLGNHDYWSDAAVVTKALEDAGARVMGNEHLILTRGADRLALVGVEDLWAGNPDPEAAVADLEPGIPRLMLTHNPDLIQELPDLKIALALAGHTHGGQMGLPVLQGLTVPSRYGSKYACGLVQGPNTRVYVSRGIGTVGLPVRVFCRPEVALLILRRPAAPEA